MVGNGCRNKVITCLQFEDVSLWVVVRGLKLRKREIESVAMVSHINSLTPGRSWFNFKSAIFYLVLLIGIFRSSYDDALMGFIWRRVNNDSDNGLVPSGNKPLPEPMLTKIYVAIWRHRLISLYKYAHGFTAVGHRKSRYWHQGNKSSWVALVKYQSD